MCPSLSSQDKKKSLSLKTSSTSSSPVKKVTDSSSNSLLSSPHRNSGSSTNQTSCKKKRSMVSLEDSLIFYDVPGTDKPPQKDVNKSHTVNSNTDSVVKSSNDYPKVNGSAKPIEKKRKSSSVTHLNQSEKKSKTDNPDRISSSKSSKSKQKLSNNKKSSSSERSRTPTPVVDLISPTGEVDELKLPWSNKTIEDVCRCDMCDFISIEMDDLIEHKKEVHAVKKLAPRLAPCEYEPVVDPNIEYKCTLCGLSDNKMRVIRRHITEIHGAKLRTCERVTHTRGIEGFSLRVETVRVYRESQPL